MEDKFVYLFKAKLYNEQGKEIDEAGVLIAANFTEAFGQITKYYDDNLISITVEVIDAYGEPARFNPVHYETIRSFFEEINI